MRWKRISALIVISLLWPVCGYTQSQPARPKAPAPQPAAGPEHVAPMQAPRNVPQAKSGASSAAPSGVKPPIDPQLKADILRLFALTKVMETQRNMAQQAFQAMGPAIVRMFPDTPHREQIAGEFIQKTVALMSSQELQNRLVAVYATYFNDKQTKALIQFYESPVGQYELAIQGRIMADARQAGSTVVHEHVPAIEAELCSDYPELRGKAMFCPATPAKAPAPAGPAPTGPAAPK